MDGATLRQEAARRAAHRCEYCHLPDWLAAIDFELDHIIAGYHHGQFTLDNVAYSCYSWKSIQAIEHRWPKPSHGTHSAPVQSAQGPLFITLHLGRTTSGRHDRAGPGDS